jgi:hypothetical protein
MAKLIRVSERRTPPKAYGESRRGTRQLSLAEIDEATADLARKAFGRSPPAGSRHGEHLLRWIAAQAAKQPKATRAGRTYYAVQWTDDKHGASYFGTSRKEANDALASGRHLAYPLRFLELTLVSTKVFRPKKTKGA